MSFLDTQDLEDEVEEVRELLYEIVTKAGLDGIETSQLAKEYEKQFVDFGIGRPLPSNWLRYVKVADEFDMRQEGDKTFISVIQRDANKLVEKVASLVQESLNVEEDDLVEQDIKLNPLPLSGMPINKSKVHILSATDPSNISIRMVSWDPMPDYLYSALSKDFSDESAKKKRIATAEGRICVAKLPNGSWERVQLVRPSTTMASKGYWVVFAVDVGVYHLVQERNLQPVSNSVCAFEKVLLAKCELANVKPSNETGIWSRNAQQAINNWINEAQETEVEIEPKSEWKLSEGPEQVPFVTANVIINGQDLSQRLINDGYAQPI